MKKVFTSSPVGFNESCTSVEIWEVENEKEQQAFYEIDDLDYEERQRTYEDMFYYSAPPVVMPGAYYEHYGYYFNGGQIIITCYGAYNV